MPAPDMRTHMEGLIDQPLVTPVTQAPNTILGFQGSRVRVATDGNPEGALISISLIQSAVDKLWDGQSEVVFNPKNRSAFLGAVLATVPEVEVLTDPRRARLRQGTLATRSLDWQPDELILALDLYLRWRPSQPPTGHADLQELSDLLQRLPLYPVATRPDNFRSPGSVRFKLGNFKNVDPTYEGASTHGSTGEQDVWSEYADAPEARAAAVKIIAAMADGDLPPLPPEEDEEGVVEGQLVYRLHRVRERNRAVVQKKKDEVFASTKRLACEACDVDFLERYGDLGEGFIEAHHTDQLALGAERATTTEDLAVVCANCHRMIHRGRPMLTIEQLQARIAEAAP